MPNDHPLVHWFIGLVESWNAQGWAEYLLWETLEGKRRHPWPFQGDFPEEDMQRLRTLRDEVQLWPYYDATIPGWEAASIKVWRLHADRTTAKDVRGAMGLPPEEP
jgi:hypothetical protein